MNSQLRSSGRCGAPGSGSFQQGRRAVTKDNASKNSVREPLPAALNPDVDYTDWASVTDVDDDELDRRILQDPDEGAAHLNLVAGDRRYAAT